MDTKQVYRPLTGERCSCKRGAQRDNCPQCEGTGWIVDFAAIRARPLSVGERVVSAHSVYYKYQPETIEQANKVPVNVVSGEAHFLGMTNGEPLIVAFDALIRYAKAYEKYFNGKLAEDAVLGESWLAATKGLQGLLDGDGAVAMEQGRTTDSKDNGACDSMRIAALKLAGFEEESNL